MQNRIYNKYELHILIQISIFTLWDNAVAKELGECIPAETRQFARESIVELELTTLTCPAPKAHHCVSDGASFVPVAAQLYLFVPVTAPDSDSSYELCYIYCQRKIGTQRECQGEAPHWERSSPRHCKSPSSSSSPRSPRTRTSVAWCRHTRTRPHSCRTLCPLSSIART